MVRTWSELWFGAFVTFGIVTLVFAVLERTQANSGWLEKWDPLKLPKVKDTRRIPRASSVFKVVFGIIAVMWLVELASSGILLNHESIQIALTQAGRGFVWMVTAMSVFGIAMSTVNMFRPFWTRARLHCGSCRIWSRRRVRADVQSGRIDHPVWSEHPSAKAVEVNAAVNTWISLFVAITGAICAMITIVDMVRLIFMNTNRPAWLSQVSGTVHN